MNNLPVPPLPAQIEHDATFVPVGRLRRHSPPPDSGDPMPPRHPFSGHGAPAPPPTDVFAATATARDHGSVEHGSVENDERIAELGEWVADRGVVVFSAAGRSTESATRTSRAPSGPARRTTPMTYQAFTRDPVARRRY